MKELLLAGTAMLTLAVAPSAAQAVPFDFTYTGNLIAFTVPTTGPYQIVAFGAQGGNSTAPGGGRAGTVPKSAATSISPRARCC